jgi:uncharacterized Tic20 family protein
MQRMTAISSILCYVYAMLLPASLILLGLVFLWLMRKAHNPWTCTVRRKQLLFAASLHPLTDCLVLLWFWLVIFTLVNNRISVNMWLYFSQFILVLYDFRDYNIISKLCQKLHYEVFIWWFHGLYRLKHWGRHYVKKMFLPRCTLGCDIGIPSLRKL